MATRKAPKRRTTKRPILHCGARVDDWDAYVYVSANRKHGIDVRENLLVLNISGEFTKAMNKVSAFILRIYPKAEPKAGAGAVPSVGIWTAAKPRFDGAIYLSFREFDLLLAMAQTGKLVSVHFSFQKTRYGVGAIASVSFSGEPPQSDDEVATG